MEYYEWLFFGHWGGSINKWAEKNNIDTGIQDVPAFFRVCVQLAGRSCETPSRFVSEMWKLGKNRLAIGQLVEANVNSRYFTTHTIATLNTDSFTDMDGQVISYTKIKRVVTIAQKPKYPRKNINVGMKLRLYNKKGSKNVYTVTAVHSKGFDAVNGSYSFKMLEYGSIDRILR